MSYDSQDIVVEVLLAARDLTADLEPKTPTQGQTGGVGRSQGR